MTWCNHYVIGASVGVMAQPSSIAVIEQVSHHEAGERELKDMRLRHLERLSLAATYPDLAQRLRAIRDGLESKEQGGGTEMLLDVTGTGSSVFEFFEKEDLRPIQVWITAGSGEIETKPRKWRIAKLELVGALQVMFNSDKLKVASGLELAPALAEELQNFRLKTPSANGDDLESWRSGKSDDLVFASALATWWANRNIPVPQKETNEFLAKMNDPAFTSWIV